MIKTKFKIDCGIFDYGYSSFCIGFVHTPYETFFTIALFKFHIDIGKIIVEE